MVVAVAVVVVAVVGDVVVAAVVLRSAEHLGPSASCTAIAYLGPFD